MLCAKLYAVTHLDRTLGIVEAALFFEHNDVLSSLLRFGQF
jgi:hypothetical protein